MFFKIGVLKNFATAKHQRWSLFLKKLKKEEAPTQVFSYKHYEIFKNSFLYRTTTSGGCFCQFDKVTNCSVLGICRHKHNQKDNMGWLFLKRCVHLCRAFSLHIVSKSHSNFKQTQIIPLPIQQCWVGSMLSSVFLNANTFQNLSKVFYFNISESPTYSK